MITALISFTLAATAQNWERLGVAPGAITYYDPASTVMIDATRRRVRVRVVYQPVRGNGVASSVLLAEIDCANHSGVLLETQHLDAAGTVIATETIPPAERRTMPAPGGGPEEAELARVCGASSR